MQTWRRTELQQMLGVTTIGSRSQVDIFRPNLVLKCIFYCLTVAQNFMQKLHATLKYQQKS